MSYYQNRDYQNRDYYNYQPQQQQYYDPRRETVGPLGNIPPASISQLRSQTPPNVKTIKMSPPKKKTSQKKDKNQERIKNWKPHDGWIKQGKSRQDQISEDSKEFAKRFEGFIQIQPEEYSLIPEGTWIRYMKYDPNSKFGFQYRSGGLLARNCYPDYWVLKPMGGKGKNWSVSLKCKNKYYRKDRGEEKRMKDKKERLWRAIDKGECVLLSLDEYRKLTNNNN